MASTKPNPNTPANDELDDILNGIVDGEDVFDTSNIAPRKEAEDRQKAAPADAGLGIDEEIKIVKKRQPVPKLDENRLLSTAGIPKLRKITKDRLKFKGKGHEYGDIARMLNMYQLWLDDLYPRAKFADGLGMIEKLGHTKRIQFMRKEWINEGKPSNTTELDRGANGATQSDDAHVPGRDRMEVDEPEDATDQNAPTSERDDEVTADAGAAAANNDFEGDGPDEDELDALLAENSAEPIDAAPSAHKTTAIEEDPFADDLEALAEMGEW